MCTLTQHGCTLTQGTSAPLCVHPACLRLTAQSSLAPQDSTVSRCDTKVRKPPVRQVCVIGSVCLGFIKVQHSLSSLLRTKIIWIAVSVRLFKGGFVWSYFQIILTKVPYWYLAKECLKKERMKEIPFIFAFLKTTRRFLSSFFGLFWLFYGKANS